MNIMKTPWRFLADLVSRKPAIERPEKADQNTNIIALEYRQVQQGDADPRPSDQADIEGGAGLQLVTPDLVAPSEDAPVPVIPVLTETSSSPVLNLLSSVAFIEEVIALDASHRRANEEANSYETPTEDKRRFSAKRANKAARGSTKIADSANDSVGDVPATRSVADEMAEVDAEIGTLRKQLAEKLRLQNDYLKRLLTRYDRR